MWKDFELAAGTAAASTSPISAVSRIEGSMELWWFRSDGGVQGAYWYEGSNWQQYELAPAGSAAGCALTSASRIPGSLEVWWRGGDGSVQGAYWYDGSTWQRYSIAPAGSVAVGGGMAALSRHPGTLEFWWVAPDGSVQGAYWYEGSNWQVYTLAPAGSAAQTSGIAAVSRISGSMELWWVAPDGAVKGAYWYEGNPWKLYTIAPSGSASPTIGIAAVSRIPGSMEMWWGAPDGSIQGAYWYEGTPWKTYTLAPAQSAAPTTRITAVSRIPGSMELWWVASNLQLQGAYWYDGATWHLYVMGSSLNPKCGMASVSRCATSLELWCVSVKFSIVDFYWYDPNHLNRKQIVDKYLSLGGEKSRLGLPIEKAMPFIPDPTGGFIAFRGGQISIKSGSIEAMKRFRVEVWWTGIECQQRQESIDEIYGVVGVIVPGSGLSKTEKYPDSGDETLKMGPDWKRISKTAIRLYDGPPMDIVLVASLIEADSGDTSDVKQKIAEQIAKAAQIGGALVGIPAEMMAASNGWLNDLTLGLVNAIGRSLGIDDDKYDPQQLRLTWTELQRGGFPKQTLRRTDDNNTIDYTHRIDLTGVDEGGDLGRYALYFDIRLFVDSEVL